MNDFHFVSHSNGPARGEIHVPGDKSISHRAIILGSIAEGITHLTGFLEGKDCLATLEAFRALGVRIDGPKQGDVSIYGVGKYGLTEPEHIIDCGNSGTTIRLMTGLLAGQLFNSQLTGDDSLLKRPMNRVCNPLQLMGAHIDADNGFPPIRIMGGQTLQGINYEMPIASAQVKSCLLLAGLYAKGETHIIEPTVSRDHTERMLAAFGYPFQKSHHTLVINSLSECHGTEMTIPGDISSAAFFIVAATLLRGQIF